MKKQTAEPRSTRMNARLGSMAMIAAVMASPILSNHVTYSVLAAESDPVVAVPATLTPAAPAATTTAKPQATPIDTTSGVTVKTADGSEVNYPVYFDKENNVFYLDARDFGLNTEDNQDDTPAVVATLQAANNTIIVQNGQETRGVAVQVSGVVNIARDGAVLDHYELRTYDSGLGQKVSGATLAGVANPANITPEEFKKISYVEEGVVEYTDSDKKKHHGIIFPIYRKDGLFQQIKIDKELPHVKGFFGDGLATTTITTSLVQFGEPWNPNENDTDNRDHAVLLVEDHDNFFVKDFSLRIKRNGDLDPAFYVKGFPYHGKVDGIHVSDSQHVTVDNVEVTGANKAGVRFTSAYNGVKKLNIGGTLRSISYCVAANLAGITRLNDKGCGDYTDASVLRMMEGNKVTNSILYQNRVAGVQFSYQNGFEISNSVSYENGHTRSGGTGYGFASEAGSMNNNITFRNNFTSHNYRKGLDIHDGDNILIENNISHGDRLLGISVYNRTFKMENVTIRNNTVFQDTHNRLERDDLHLNGAFDPHGDYLQFEAIHLQTNEKARRLSTDGSRGHFEISGNTIRGLDESGNTHDGKSYIANAMLVRMQEPYLDYELIIDNNDISGVSANNIFKIINSALDGQQLGREFQKDFSKFSNGIGYGSGDIRITNNIVNVDRIVAEVGKYAPINISETTRNVGLTTTDGKTTEMGQNKFHGSLKFNNNNIKFKESVIGKSSNQESVISINTNAKKIEMTGNAIDMGKIVSAYATLKPLINVTGLTGHTVQPQVNGYTMNTGAKPSNLPSMLQFTQPFVFAGNKITVDSVDLTSAAAAKPLRVLSSQFTLRYARDNEFIAKNPLNLATSTDGMDAYEDAEYSADVTATAGTLKDDARTNFALTRMAEETTEDSSKELPIRMTAIIDENLPLGQTVEDKPLVNVSVARKVGKAAVNNAIIAAANKGGRNVLDPYPDLKTHYYKLGNLTDDKDGLLLGDYIVSTGTSAGKVLESKKEIAMKGVTINDLTRYEKMPVALKDAFEIEYEIANPDVRPVERTVRVGTLRTVYDAVKTEEEINFEITEEKTDTLKKGEKQIKTPGQKGKKEIVYRDLKNAKTGVVLKHTAAVERVIKKPVTQVVLVGTKEDTTAIDTTNLQNKITEAETALNDPKTVADANKTALQNKITEAKAALDDTATLTVTKRDGLVHELTQLIGQLTKNDGTTPTPAIDTTNLQNKITEAETALNDPKTVADANKTALQNKITEAKAALDDTATLTVTKRDGLVHELTQLIGQLTKNDGTTPTPQPQPQPQPPLVTRSSSGPGGPVWDSLIDGKYAPIFETFYKDGWISVGMELFSHKDADEGRGIIRYFLKRAENGLGWNLKTWRNFK